MIDIKICEECGIEINEKEISYFTGYCFKCYGRKMKDLREKLIENTMFFNDKKQIKECGRCANLERVCDALNKRIKTKNDEIAHLEFVLEKVSKKLMLARHTDEYFEFKNKLEGG